MSGFSFYKDELEEHRQGLGQYAGETEYVKASSRSIRARELAEFKKFANRFCNNINLVVDNRGGFCNYCQHYHFRYPFGIEISRCEPVIYTDAGNNPWEILVSEKYMGVLEVSTITDSGEEVMKMIACEKTRRVWKPLFVTGGNWKGQHKSGEMISCYWNPEAETDSFSFGNQPPEGIINCGAHPSEWTVPEDEDEIDEEEKKVKFKKQDTRHFQFIESVFANALKDDEEDMKKKFPGLFD
jgi:hypothetical protein